MNLMLKRSRLISSLINFILHCNKKSYSIFTLVLGYHFTRMFIYLLLKINAENNKRYKLATNNSACGYFIILFVPVINKSSTYDIIALILFYY